MLNSDIAIDFGTNNLRIFLLEKGIVVDEPAYMAVDTKKEEVVAVGREAQIMLGRVAKHIAVETPFKKGAVVNYPMAEHMLTKYVKRVDSSALFLPNTIAIVSPFLNDLEKRILIHIIEETGIRKITFLKEPIADALGVGIDIFKPNGNMIVNLGGSKITISIIASGEIVDVSQLGIGGNDFDKAIIKYIRKKYALEIGQITAEKLKLEIGSVAPTEKLLECTVRGRNLNTDHPHEIKVTSDDMVAALAEYSILICEEIQKIYSNASPLIANDISLNGIVLVGGTSKILGLEDLIQRKVGIKATLAQNSQENTISGGGKALEVFQGNKNSRIFSKIQ